MANSMKPDLTLWNACADDKSLVGRHHADASGHCQYCQRKITLVRHHYDNNKTYVEWVSG